MNRLARRGLSCRYDLRQRTGAKIPELELEMTYPVEWYQDEISSWVEPRELRMIRTIETKGKS
jgi:hypothetical protein